MELTLRSIIWKTIYNFMTSESKCELKNICKLFTSNIYDIKKIIKKIYQRFLNILI